VQNTTPKSRASAPLTLSFWFIHLLDEVGVHKEMLLGISPLPSSFDAQYQMVHWATLGHFERHLQIELLCLTKDWLDV
jgi:hypothetical protein